MAYTCTCMCVSLLLSLYFSLVSSTFLDFRLENVDPNELILECYDSVSGTIDSGATIDFFFPGASVPHMSSLTGPSNTGLPHTVTPVNEAFLRCTASDGSGDMSVEVAIAGMKQIERSMVPFSSYPVLPQHLH